MSRSTVSCPSFDPWRPIRRLRELLEGVSFWTAVVLPFLYVPSLVLGELVPVPPLLIAFAVWLNALALLVGHRHQPRYSQG